MTNIMFEFATATRIMFGHGLINRIGTEAVQLGRRALVITGTSSERASLLFNQLKSHDIGISEFHVSSEPTVDIVIEGIMQAQYNKSDLVIGIGGGSVLDTGKSISVLLTNVDDPYKYLEVIGEGKEIINPGVPFIAIPTTAGTGTEVTRNAVLGVPDHRIKVSLRSIHLLPRLALVDPELTYTLPANITAFTGLDALTQLIEPFVSNQSNPLVDALCRDGIKRIARSLRKAFDNGADCIARTDMSLASLFGGLALANAKLGAVHGFAGPIGGKFAIPHGIICGRLLPAVMEINVTAMLSRTPENISLARYNEVAQIFIGDKDASIYDGISWIKELCDYMEVPGFIRFGIKQNDFPKIIEKAAYASSMKGNPIQLTTNEMEEILIKSM